MPLNSLRILPFFFRFFSEQGQNLLFCNFYCYADFSVVSGQSFSGGNRLGGGEVTPFFFLWKKAIYLI